MKAKKIDQKLVLNKKTVAHLNIENMDAVRAGAPPTKRETLCPPTCYTCNWECL